MYEEDPPEFKSYGYYIISLEWMGRWRGFVNGKNEAPGPIDNAGLARRIHNGRKKLGYTEYDDE